MSHDDIGYRGGNGHYGERSTLARALADVLVGRGHGMDIGMGVYELAVDGVMRARAAYDPADRPFAPGYGPEPAPPGERPMDRAEALAVLESLRDELFGEYGEPAATGRGPDCLSATRRRVDRALAVLSRAEGAESR